MADEANDDRSLPSALNLRVGEEWVAHLPGLGSAGYAWQVEVGDAEVIESRLTPIQRGTGPEPPNTYNVDELLTLRAAAPGRSTVRLVQRRPWEEDRAPLREYELMVRVDQGDPDP